VDVDLQLPASDEDRAMFNAATVIQLGNGRKASFWNSRWRTGDTLAARFPALHKHRPRLDAKIFLGLGTVAHLFVFGN